MSREYIAMHKKCDKKIYFKYDFFGVLEEVKFYGERWKEEQVKWIFESKRNHYCETEMLKLCEIKDMDFDYRAIPTDLSFENFWKTYGYKKGKLVRAQRLWGDLKDAERLEALLYIPIYKHSKAIDKTAMLYPETYLYNKVWLAEKI